LASVFSGASQAGALVIARRVSLRCLLSILVFADLAVIADAQDFGGGFPGFAPEHGIAYYLGIVVLSAILGALFGALFSDQAKPFRRVLWIVLLAVFVLAAVIYSWTASDIVAFLIGFAVAYKLLAIAKASRHERDITFGSAEWATLQHLQERNVIGDSGFFLGQFVTDAVSAQYETDIRLHYTGDRHLLTIAPTRSGKGTSAIVPNLLTYQESALVIDPKGENARMTAARRGDGHSAAGIPGMGQKVHVVDPWAITWPAGLALLGSSVMRPTAARTP
jgi:type IV secretory pathway TraG/TraD family ATPase VirD4